MADSARLKDAPCILCGIARGQRGARSAPVRFADWLHRRPTRSESASLSRTLARLQTHGLVRRLPGGRVKLTAVGRKAAEAYLKNLWLPVELPIGPPERKQA